MNSSISAKQTHQWQWISNQIRWRNRLDEMKTIKNDYWLIFHYPFSLVFLRYSRKWVDWRDGWRWVVWETFLWGFPRKLMESEEISVCPPKLIYGDGEEALKTLLKLECRWNWLLQATVISDPKTPKKLKENPWFKDSRKWSFWNTTKVASDPSQTAWKWTPPRENQEIYENFPLCHHSCNFSL